MRKRVVGVATMVLSFVACGRVGFEPRALRDASIDVPGTDARFDGGPDAPNPPTLDAAADAPFDAAIDGGGPTPPDANVDAPSGSYSAEATRSLACGDDHVCARTLDERIVCWGANEQGQLGRGLSSPAEVTPLTPPALAATTVSDLAAGGKSTCIVRKLDGAVLCWGDNRGGILPGVSASSVTAPMEVALPRAANRVVVGRGTACAALVTGEVVCWGGSTFGERGTGEIGVGPFIPTVAATIERVTDLSLAGNTVHAITSTNELWGWGQNNEFQVGSGVPGLAAVPAMLGDVVGARMSATGSLHTCAVDAEGSAYLWGSNSHGQVGGSAGVFRRSRPGLLTTVGPWTDCAVFGESSCVVRMDGKVFCFGSNVRAQVRLPADGLFRYIPVEVGTGMGAMDAVTGGNSHACALRADRSAAVCWGESNFGQLGPAIPVMSGVYYGAQAIPLP